LENFGRSVKSGLPLGAQAADERPREEHAAENLLEETMITPMRVDFFVEALGV